MRASIRAAIDMPALLGHGVSVSLTHQALADELGMVRAIVTRQLERFEQSGLVVLGREHIELRDAAALRAPGRRRSVTAATDCSARPAQRSATRMDAVTRKGETMKLHVGALDRTIRIVSGMALVGLTLAGTIGT